MKAIILGTLTVLSCVSTVSCDSDETADASWGIGLCEMCDEQVNECGEGLHCGHWGDAEEGETEWRACVWNTLPEDTPACPAERPENGSECPEPTQFCEYANELGLLTNVASCTCACPPDDTQDWPMWGCSHHIEYPDECVPSTPDPQVACTIEANCCGYLGAESEGDYYQYDEGEDSCQSSFFEYNGEGEFSVDCQHLGTEDAICQCN